MEKNIIFIMFLYSFLHSADLALKWLLGSISALFGASWTLSGGSWAPLGRLLDALGRLLGALGRLLGFLGRLLGALGERSGASWVALGRSSGSWARSWAAVGRILGALERLCGPELLQGRSGPSLRPLQDALGPKFLYFLTTERSKNAPDTALLTKRPICKNQNKT